MAVKFVRASSQRLSVGSSPITAYPFTLAIWFQTTNPTIGGNQNAIALNHSGNDADSAGIGIDNVNGKVQFYVSNGSATSDTSDVVVASANTWTNGVYSCASATSRTGYVNGGNATLSTVNITNGGSANLLTIGAFTDTSPGDFWDGLLAESAIWNVALNASEAAAYAAGVSPYRIRPGNLVFYAPLWGLSSTEPDLSGSARNLTPANTPTQANHAPTTLWTPKIRTSPLQSGVRNLPPFQRWAA